jgi:hypothetical protein
MNGDANKSSDACSIVRFSPYRYLHSIMVRILFSLFVGLAMFLSPLAMANGAALAASPSGTAAVSDTADHCSGTGTTSDHDKAPKEMNCSSACAASLPDAFVAASVVPSGKAVPSIRRAQLLVSVHPEGETPPPRVTPEI